MIEQLVFYFFSGVFIIAGSMVVIVRSPVRAALFLVLAFCTSAGLWLLLEAEFLAITLVLVYVGAVMVLFLFVVMMLDVKTPPLHESFIRYFPVGMLVALLIAAELSMVVGTRHFGLELFAAPARHAAEYSNTEALGLILYTDYVYPFEIAAVILLVAMIAAIALTMRRRHGVKYQEPGNQVTVQREDRVRLVKM
uniref:NADH-quinone oxidoreductase subunit J n=1 Tax=Candidatus Kentrum sp. LFY TaxID=2126342 RepID=A0A450UY23_9GAMM|nr:MAG: NADH dehydrogenase subunit J [Candidatus Kentron sp. LFY]VFJ97436.1 MAG: NADH dehydrogenase subunit J [Candidatus Kentron sp. LFY]